jgi:hypothetical protein
VFGGGSADGDYLDDTWRLDPQALELREISVQPAPPARSGAALIVDARNGDVLLFGGQGFDGLFADAWFVSGAL